MKTLMTIGVTESIFWLNTNTESTEDSNNPVKIQVESEVSIIDSIIETIVEPIIYKC